MKKFTLTLAALAAATALNATDYLIGDAIEAADIATMSGEYKVIMRLYSKKVPGFFHTEQVSDTDERIYFGMKTTELDQDATEFTEDYVYTINVTDGAFTIQNSVGAYAPLPSTNSTSNYIYSTCTSVDEAGTFAPLSCITTSGYTDYYMLQAQALASGTSGHREVHAGDNGGWAYFSTGDAGMADAGGMANNSSSASRTAAAFKLYHANEITFPMEGYSYRLVNTLSSDARANTYLGYYPSEDTPWYLWSTSSLSRDSKINLPIIASGNVARMTVGDTQEEVDGQLWQFVAGTDDNAGKYCIVNAAYPDGAIGSAWVDNSATGTATANAASRWAYVSDRTANADDVAWFELDANSNGESYRFKNGNYYMNLAGNGQYYQINRYNGSDGSFWWIPEHYVAADEEYDAQSVFDEGVAELKGIAEGCAAMKSVIGGEDCPTVEMPEGTTALTMETALEEANATYAEYIAKFNGKWVTLYNNRRASGTNGYTANNPWLAVLVNSAGDVVTNTYTSVNDDCIWQMVVDSNKLRFYNRTTGYTLKSALLIPSVANGGVKFLIEGGSNYVHLSGTSGNLMEYNVADDAGSVWTVAPAEYTFCVPEVSTAAEPKYYRILSDRWISNGASPMLGINGENRDESGEGELVGKSNLAGSGIYWRIEASGNDGAVKIYNLVDGYAMGGVQSQSGNKTDLAMLDEDAEEFYLINLADKTLSDGTSFDIANSYAICSESTIGSNNCLDALASASDGANARVSEWTPVSSLEVRNNFNNNGSLWYFILASDDEVAGATASYVSAVKSRIAISEVVDDTENLVALSHGDYKGTYSTLVGERNDYAATITNASTISEVNALKRNGDADVPTLDEITAEVNAIVETYVPGQHVQLWTAKEESNWATRWMKDNGTKIEGTADETDFATVWTIEKNDDGGYIIVNASSGKAIGAPASNINMYDVDSDNVQVYDLIYSPVIGRFAISKYGVTESTSTAIHMSQSGGTIVNWSYTGIENSHWAIQSLKNPDVTVESNGNGGHIVKINNGEFTDKAAAGVTVVTIYKLNAATEAEEGEEAIVALAADENATVHATFTATQFEDGAAAIDTELTAGTYALEVPGAMVTNNGYHTRAYYTTFAVDADGVVTGVEEVVAAAETEAVKVYYDLMGRRVANPGRGIYICNGKKIYLR